MKDGIIKNAFVSYEAPKQVMRERDLAISQLNEIGKGLGEKMDDIPIAKDYKYRWHDLRKDVNDLPEIPNDSIHIKRYIVVNKDGEQSMLMWAGGWNCCFNSDGTIYRDGELTDIIAWREIEPFNMECKN